jgi:phosphate transport system substrate-binding protein
MRALSLPLLFLMLCGTLIPGAGARAQNTIDGRADSVALRAFGAEATRLFQLNEHRRVRLAMLSTVSAIEAVARGEVEIALTARGRHELKPDESGTRLLRQSPGKHWPWSRIPATRRPSLSLRQIRDIYLGKITRWDQVGGPHARRSISTPSPARSTAPNTACAARCSAPATARWRPTRWYLNTEQLEAAIAIDPNALGVSALSNVHANNRKLRARSRSKA